MSDIQKELNQIISIYELPRLSNKTRAFVLPLHILKSLLEKVAEKAYNDGLDTHANAMYFEEWWEEQNLTFNEE